MATTAATAAVDEGGGDCGRARDGDDDAALSKDRILALRRAHLCPALTVSYANTDPLLIVRGRGCYLYDEAGAEYLDTRNNVAHVGHCHPTVVAAVAAQVAALNTNTRYLHPSLVLLASRLLAHFPPSLDKVFFVNSGSEANDLALRLAWAHTHRRDVVVVAHGYHGHTAATLAVSPYKAEGPGGEGLPDHVHKVRCPDVYRDPAAGEGFVADVLAVCDRVPVAAFLMESGMSVGGVVLPPAGCLPRAYDAVRRTGGLCIADEVQTGFGRFGRHFWGFEQQGVVPDIVTLGKPMGNGMPLAAVVTTAAVSASFATTGMEYFNTFGGNCVSCAAGLAVLDVLRDERLPDGALQVGTYLAGRLRALAADAPPADGPTPVAVIGDVRGSGLFLGVELVRAAGTREPAPAAASAVCSRLKAVDRVLTSLDGPHHNVLVLKPPLCFGAPEADRLVAALAAALRGLTAADVAETQHTPT